jgi:hypothetical protein
VFYRLRLPLKTIVNSQFGRHPWSEPTLLSLKPLDLSWALVDQDQSMFPPRSMQFDSGEEENVPLQTADSVVRLETVGLVKSHATVPVVHLQHP